jgi:hypothetical protein
VAGLATYLCFDFLVFSGSRLEGGVVRPDFGNECELGFS